jgi:DNA polymerase-3 subunit gamma/tau
LSRCQRFDFHRIGETAIKNHLKQICAQEGVTAEAEALALLAARAQGGLRDAIGLLDQCIVASEGNLDMAVVTQVLGIVDADFVANIALAVAECDPQTVVLGVQTLVDEGRDLRQFLQQLLEYVRNQILIAISGKGQAKIGAGRSLQILRDLVEGDQRLKTSLAPRLTLEIALLGACRLESGNKTRAKSPKEPKPNPAAHEMPAASVKTEVLKADGLLEPNQWKAVLQQVKRHSVVCEAFLKMAVAAELSGSELVVSFRPINQIHQSGVEKPENKAKIEQALSELFGRLMKLRTVSVAE